MRISEFASITGQSASSIRYYEQLGLLKPERSAAGYRIYSEDELERITLIQVAQELGFTLDALSTMLIGEARKLTDDEHSRILQLLSQRKQALVTQQQKIAEQVHFIEQLSYDLQSTWQKGECFQFKKLTKQLKSQ